MPDLKTLQRWMQTDWRAHKKWREDAAEDFRFIAGDQWSDKDKDNLESTGRVPIVFNRTATIINSVVGSEINNRTEVRFMPRTLGDADINEKLTKGAEWFRDQAGAEEEDSQAFFDAVVCGLGWVETLMDFESDAEGEPKMERINPLEMVWDASAERRGLSDAKRVARVRQIGIEDAQEMWPDHAVTDLDAKWLDRDRDSAENPHHQWSDDQYPHANDNDDPEDEEDQTVTVIQLQYKQRVKEVQYKDPMTGQIGQMGKREFERMRKMLRERGLDPQFPTRDIVRYEWKQVILGNEIIEENQPCRDKCTFTPITGYWDNGKRSWFGLLRQMKDPQRFANKWLSQTLHIINANSKGGVMIEEGATDDPEAFEESWAAADSALWVKPGTLTGGKIVPKPGVQMPAALMQLTEFAISSIRDVSGVNQELLGMRDENQPGVLEYQRKQAAMTTLAVLFDALRQYRKQQAEVMLFYMVEYMADGRLIRITDEEGDRYEPLTVDPGVRKYDVIVDDAPSSPNNKERVWETIMALMPVLTQAGLPKEIWAEIIEYAPFPAALIEKLKEYAKKPDEPDPMAQQAQQLALQKLAAEVQEKLAETEREKANAFENMAQGYEAMAKANMRPAEMAAEYQKDMAQADLARAKMGHDATKANMDFVGKMAQIKAQAEKPQGRGDGA